MEMRMKLKMLRTDRGGEFISNEFTKYCKENGIARQLAAPYSPQQNGVVERRNRTVLSTTRRLEEESKACRLYDPIAKRKHVSRDVKFMETKPWGWNKDDTSTQDTFWASFIVEGVDNENTIPVNTKINDNIDDTITLREGKPLRVLVKSPEKVDAVPNLREVLSEKGVYRKSNDDDSGVCSFGSCSVNGYSYYDSDDIESRDSNAESVCQTGYQKNLNLSKKEFAAEVAIVSKAFGWDCFLVRLVGSFSEIEASKAEIRVRHSWQNDEWVVIGKVHTTSEYAQCGKLIKCNIDSGSLEKQRNAKGDSYLKSLQFGGLLLLNVLSVFVLAKTRKKANDDDNGVCSVGSYSVNSYTCYDSDDIESRDSDAESVCQTGYQENLNLSKKEFAAEVHRLELQAYRCTIEALHASGPLTWEKETMAQS
nr:agenet-like domain-containing protein [Tanacetum cinerariifolium]